MDGLEKSSRTADEDLLSFYLFVESACVGLLTIEIIEIRLVILIVIWIYTWSFLFLLYRCCLLCFGLCRDIGRRLGLTPLACSGDIVLLSGGS